MKKFYKILQKILLVSCVFIIAWFFVYFLRGEEFSITFSDRVFASYFPQILVFTTGVSIYLLFIFQVKSKFKWWKKLLILVIGFLVATAPFLLYHGYFQYQCGFWNNEIVSEKAIYENNIDNNQSVKVIIYSCKVDKPGKVDTLLCKQITPYFELQNPVKIEKGENSNWELFKKSSRK